MTDKFYGTIEELQELVASAGEQGNWTAGAHDSHEFRTKDGGIFKWWPSTGTLDVQGKKGAADRLRSNVFPALRKGVEGAVSAAASTTAAPGHDSTIFVVHGHDVAAREQLELILHRMGLEPYVLANTAGGGQTIIEALEGKIGKDAPTGFGIVLLTPDDRGFKKKGGETNAQDRARQNVILEMGMILASLTRQRMAVLVKGAVEYPSDIEGVIRIHFSDHVKDAVPKLAERLRECGFEIPIDKLMRAQA